MIDVIMKNESPSLDYCLKITCCGPKAFSQFIDTLIETKQNDFVHLFEDHLEFQTPPILLWYNKQRA